MAEDDIEEGSVGHPHSHPPQVDGELERLVKENPIAAIMGALLVGVVLGRIGLL